MCCRRKQGYSRISPREGPLCRGKRNSGAWSRRRCGRVPCRRKKTPLPASSTKPELWPLTSTLCRQQPFLTISSKSDYFYSKKRKGVCKKKGGENRLFIVK